MPWLARHCSSGARSGLGPDDRCCSLGLGPVLMTEPSGAVEAVAQWEHAGFVLKERRLDDDCGCPEEFWDTPFGELHLHLSAGKPSNACLDNGDEGEWALELTRSTVAEARSAFLAWATVASSLPTPSDQEKRISELEAGLRTASDAINEMFRYFDGGETRGSYDGRPERNQLRKAGYELKSLLSPERSPK